MHVCIRNTQHLEAVALPKTPYLISRKEKVSLKDLEPSGTRIRLFPRRSWPCGRASPSNNQRLKLVLLCQALNIFFSSNLLMFLFYR